MSKKIIILIEFVVCFIATIMISIFGINPENWRDYKYTEYLNFTETNIQLEADDDSCEISWEIGPYDATIKTISFIYDKNICNISEIDYNNCKAIVTFVQKIGVTITGRTQDGKKNTSRINITFSNSGSGNVELD